MFSIRDVAKLRERKESIKKETFRVLLNKCTNRIKDRATQGADEMFIDIPPIVVGYPPYDIVFATKYIARQISRLGFMVTIPFPGRLYVSWKKIPKDRPQYIESEPDFKALTVIKETASKLKRKK